MSRLQPSVERKRGVHTHAYSIVVCLLHVNLYLYAYTRTYKPKNSHCRGQEEHEEKAAMRFSQTMQQKGAHASAVGSHDNGINEWVDESRALVQSWATVPSDWDRGDNPGAPPRVSSTDSAHNHGKKASAQVKKKPPARLWCCVLYACARACVFFEHDISAYNGRKCV